MLAHIIVFIISAVVTYYFIDFIQKIISPETYYRAKVLKMYELGRNTKENVDNINALSHITGLYATHSQHEPPKDEDLSKNIVYKNYKVNKNMNSGGGLSYDTRTGEFITRVALWVRD